MGFRYVRVFFFSSKRLPGNALLHQMTYSRTYAVRLDVELVSGGYDFATYENFRVNSEDKRYILANSYMKLTYRCMLITKCNVHLCLFSSPYTQRYSTYATGVLSGDSSITGCLRYIGNRPFTTRDRDHDSYSGEYPVT